MARRVTEYPFFPQALPQTLQGVLSTWGTLVRQILRTFNEYGQRLNRVLPKDGTEAMDGPLPLMTYTASELPTASEHTGAIVYVSDGSAGQKFRGSDGANWVNLG